MDLSTPITSIIDSVGLGSYETDVDIAKIIAFYFVASLTVHYLCGVFSSIFLPHYNEYAPTDNEKQKAKNGKPFTKGELATYKFKKQLDWNMTIESGFSSLYMTVFYLICVNELFLNGNVHDHWHKRTVISTHAIALHLAASLYETVIYLLSGKSLEFYAHHALVVISCGTFLGLGRGHLWCCWLGLVEGSNPALCMVTSLRQIPSMKGGTVYTLSGAMLWVTYLICRVISAPACMWSFHDDMAKHPEVALMSEDESVHLAWHVLMWVCFVFIYGLSMWWFYLITKGLYKALSGGHAAPKEGKKE